MAAKKAKGPKKPASRKTKKAAGARRDDLACCPLGDLRDGLVLTLGAECILGSAEYVHADATFFNDPVLVRMQDVPGCQSDASGRDAGMRQYRLLFERKDYGDEQRPFLRYVGRVFEVLLRHRGQSTCTVGDVFRVFLSEIPQHLKATHQHRPRPNGTFDVTTTKGRATFNNRASELRDYDLLEPTVSRPTRNENWRLTGFGSQVFDEWPDVPGLRLQQPPETGR